MMKEASNYPNSSITELVKKGKKSNTHRALLGSGIHWALSHTLTLTPLRTGHHIPNFAHEQNKAYARGKD